jgi:putative transposase
MRAAGLRARVATIYKSTASLRSVFSRNPNLLWKHCAKKPNEVWVSDVTYLSVAGSWRYLAVVMDQNSRRIVGWSLGRGRGVSLTRAAFDQALRRRRPSRGLIFHSDRGIEYAGLAMEGRLKAVGARQSMSRGGCPGDNSHAESFFHSLKADVIHGFRFDDDRQLRACIRSYVPFYNVYRSHSSLGFVSPVEYERRCA